MSQKGAAKRNRRLLSSPDESDIAGVNVPKDESTSTGNNNYNNLKIVIQRMDMEEGAHAAHEENHITNGNGIQTRSRSSTPIKKRKDILTNGMNEVESCKVDTENNECMEPLELSSDEKDDKDDTISLNGSPKVPVAENGITTNDMSKSVISDLDQNTSLQVNVGNDSTRLEFSTTTITEECNCYADGVDQGSGTPTVDKSAISNNSTKDKTLAETLRGLTSRRTLRSVPSTCDYRRRVVTDKTASEGTETNAYTHQKSAETDEFERLKRKHSFYEQEETPFLPSKRQKTSSNTGLFSKFWSPFKSRFRGDGDNEIALDTPMLTKFSGTDKSNNFSNKDSTSHTSSANNLDITGSSENRRRICTIM